MDGKKQSTNGRSDRTGVRATLANIRASAT